MRPTKRGRHESEEDRGGGEEAGGSASSSVRRSTRESRPSSLRRQDEWQLEKKLKMTPSSAEISPGRVSRRSRDGQSPGSLLQTKGIRKLSPVKHDDLTRRTRGSDQHSGARHSPKGELTRRTRNGKQNMYNEDSEDVTDDDINNSGLEVDSPFYPAASSSGGGHHVRFSPSAKTAPSNTDSSPFGRKTRSSRRGLSSYIQSLPSEDEETAFNRHYK